MSFKALFLLPRRCRKAGLLPGAFPLHLWTQDPCHHCHDSGLVAALAECSGSRVVQVFPDGGATQALGPNETAFVHRNSEWLASIEIDWIPGQTSGSRVWAHRWQKSFTMTSPRCAAVAPSRISPIPISGIGGRRITVKTCRAYRPSIRRSTRTIYSAIASPYAP